MERISLEFAVKEGLTLKQLAQKFNCSQNKVRCWVRKYELKLRRGPKGKFPKDWQTPRKCACGETDPAKFYGHKVRICAKCHNKANHDMGRKKRQYIITKLGGRCANKNCGYNKYPSALDVHHLDPAIKDGAYASHRSWSYKRIDKEIENCVLLCRNCHQAHHCGDIELEFE